MPRRLLRRLVRRHCTLPGGLLLRYGAAEPVLETRRTDARVIAGGEALIVQRGAEVKCVGICDYLPCISVRAQKSSDEFVETYQVGTGQLDRDRKSTRLNSSHLVISYAV